MLTYAIPLVPGPTRVPESVRRAYLTDYASADLEPEYSQLYADVQEQLRAILNTRNQIALMTGEGMIALWGALKSCIRPGERVLAVSTGVFGHGIGEMAAAIGAKVRWVEFGYDEVIQPERVEEAIRDFRPRMVTAVHCETPSGTLNPVGLVGAGGKIRTGACGRRVWRSAGRWGRWPAGCFASGTWAPRPTWHWWSRGWILSLKC